MKINVLDKGFVYLVDKMGDDNRIVQSARVSYGEGTKSYREDRDLIRYLMENQHTSPFEQVVFVFHMKLPIFVARQIVRSRTARLNECSGRYSELPEEFYVPNPENVATQSTNNKQGRGETFEPNTANHIISNMKCMARDEFKHYKWMLEQNVAREIARINLPLSTYTEWYWQMDLRNLFHFLKLRLDSHAQYETRVYAEAVYQIIKPIVPIACEAFEDFVLNAKTFSAKEVALIKQHLENFDFSTLTNKEKSKFIKKLEV